MSEYFVTVWHSDYGLPKNFDEGSQLDKSLHENSKAVSENLLPYYQAFFNEIIEFAKKASYIYWDEELFGIAEINTTFFHSIHEINLPHSGFEETHAVIALAAQKHGFVMFNSEAGVMIPNGEVYHHSGVTTWKLRIPYNKWLRTLKNFDKPLKKLPKQNGKLINHNCKMIKQYLTEAGLPELANTGNDNILVDMGRHQCKMYLGGHLTKFTEKTSFSSIVYIHINDLVSLNDLLKTKGYPDNLYHTLKCDWSVFYKLTKDPNPEVIFRYYIKDLDMLNAEIKRGIDMFNYIYPNLKTNLQGLYTFFYNSYADPHLCKHTFRGVTHFFVPPIVMIALARLTKQPNFDSLVDYFRQLILDELTPECINKRLRQEKELKLNKPPFEKREDKYIDIERYDTLVQYLRLITDDEIDAILAIENPWKDEIFTRGYVYRIYDL